MVATIADKVVVLEEEDDDYGAIGGKREFQLDSIRDFRLIEVGGCCAY